MSIEWKGGQLRNFGEVESAIKGMKSFDDFNRLSNIVVVNYEELNLSAEDLMKLGVLAGATVERYKLRPERK